MHKESMMEMKAFADKYANADSKVLGVGSLNVKDEFFDGTYRELFGAGYLGLDIVPGENVDIVSEDPYNWPVEDNSFDIVVSGSTLEHVEFPELTMAEIQWVLKPDGYCCITAPSTGFKHNFPDDYRRYNVNDLKALAENAQLSVVSAFIEVVPIWNDAVLVAKKGIVEDSELGRIDTYTSKKVSVVIPVVRVEESLKCIEAVINNAGIPREDFEIVTAIDYERIGCPKMLQGLVARAKYDLICFLGDDTIPQKDFLKIALDEMIWIRDGWGVVGLNSGGNPYAHFLADKRIMEHIPGGELYSTEYEHCFGDAEIFDIANDIGRWIYAEMSIVEHKHPIFGTAPYDKHYLGAYEGGKFERDQVTYRRRKLERLAAQGKELLAVAFPLTDTRVYTNFMFSFLNMDKPSNYYIFMPDFPGNHDAVRNNLVKQAFESSCTHILMMDTDQIYVSKDMIARMMGHKLPVVGARVHRRYPPFDPILYRGEIGSYHSVPDEEIEAARKNGNPLVESDATGCGCILYDLMVFANMPEPWFELTIDEKTGAPVGEDIGFCSKLKKEGHKIFVDCSIEIQHLTLHATDWNTYKVWRKMNPKLLGADGANLKP